MIFLDLETRSAEDLRRAGGRRYAEHPSTRLLTAAWIHGDQRHVWIPGVEHLPRGYAGIHLPSCVVYTGPSVPEALDPSVPWVAHNAWEFDELVWRKLYPHHQPDEWIDTSILAKQQGWPGRLDALGKLLRGEGKTKGHNKRFFDAHHKEPGVGDLFLIAKYNLDDVEIMRQLWDRLHPDMEPAVTAVHRAINNRGVRIDVPLLRRLRDVCVGATEREVVRCAELSEGTFKSLEDLRKRDKVFTWLEKRGCKLASLDKKLIEQWINDEGDEPDVEVLHPDVVPFLRARMGALRITSAKLDAALSSVSNSRLDGLYNYCGAGVTRRWSARRMQVHNLPRPAEGIDPWGLLDKVYTCETFTADEVSAMIRFVFLPEEGEYIAACDYNAVESRVLAWLAGERKLLDDFWAGRSPYFSLASKIAGRPVTHKKDPFYMPGKVGILGCGYRLGEEGFKVYAKANGLDLEAAGTSAASVVYGFRENYTAIVHFWDLLDYAAVKCVETGDRQRVGKVEFRFDGSDLYLYLPSGGRLTFRRARVGEGRFGNRCVMFWSHMGFVDDLHGGKIAGLATQGTARELLAAAMVRLRGQVVLHVHDELVASVKGRAEAEAFAKAMVELPPWAPDLPLAAECDVMERYAKSARDPKTQSFTVRP